MYTLTLSLRRISVFLLTRLRTFEGNMLQKLTILLFSILSGIHSEESDQPSTVLAPRDFNHHAYDTPIIQNRLSKPKPTEKGPVLFPNDGLPQPKAPLVVTSRPLAEQLSKYLNSKPEHNNTLASSSFISQKYEPNYLARFNTYKPFSQIFSTQNPVLINPVTGTPLYPVNNLDDFTAKNIDDDKDFYDYSGKNFDGYSGRTVEDYEHPYADVVKKSTLLNDGFNTDNRYNDYELHDLDIKQKVKTFTQLTGFPRAPIHSALQKLTSILVPTPARVFRFISLVHACVKYLRCAGKIKTTLFSYTVKDHHTGDDFSHSQQSTGSATNGEYRVRLPDGRMQIVSYTADENGYKADVRYDDEHADRAGNSIEYSRSTDHNTAINNQNSLDDPYKSRDRDEYYNRYTDASKEGYTDDHNFRYNNFNEPYKHNFNYDTNTKLGVIVVPNHQGNTISTVKPSYEQLKPLFVTKARNAASTAERGHDRSRPLFSTRNRGTASTVKPTYEQLKPLFVTANPGTASTIKPIYERSRPVFTNKNFNAPTTVKPSYDELKPLFVTRKPLIPTTRRIPVEINAPSTTAHPFGVQPAITERVVVIGASKPPLYKNIGNSPNTLDVPFTTAKYFYSPSPAVQILPTAGPLVKNVNLSTESKAILSDSFINRINKYLSFK
ncbi:Pro-resilin [Eumeta japonica]|uniref:Pro-resilin n=1 Tax=Eumeta variegata TaxID=151549 RepID=A0A4C1YY73_EUMVA|nr:Pro-resilin [Eumeta japonica]